MSVLLGTAFRLLEQTVDQPNEKIWSSLSTPQNTAYGDICSNLALSMSHDNAMEKADEIVAAVDDTDAPLSATSSGSYINFSIDDKQYFDTVFDKFDFSQRTTDAGSILIETAPPNIGDWYSPLLYRGLCIWEGLSGICEHLGYDVTQMLFWNDCGKPAGTLLADRISAKKNPWNDGESPFQDTTGAYLATKLESYTDGELQNFWKTVRSENQQDLLRFLDSHGFHWDNLIRESDTWEHLDDLRDRLIQSEFVEVDDDNSILIRFPETDLPPRIAFKSNGASVYFVRDLAELQRRVNQSYDHTFYVVSLNQQTHLDQLFTTAKALEMPNISQCEHVAYGLVDGKSDTLGAFFERLRNYIVESRLSYEDDISTIVRSVMRLYLLNRTRTKEMHSFSKDIRGESLNAECSLLYSLSRVKSLVQKIRGAESTIEEYDDTTLTQEEQTLLKHVDQRWDVLEECFENRDPYPLVRYLQLLSNDFNSFYENCPVIIGGNAHPIRRNLCLMTEVVIETAFDILNLPYIDQSGTPE